MQKVLKSPGNERLLITALQYPRDGKLRIVWIPGRVVVIIPFLYFLTLPRFICFNYAADGTVVFLANALTSFAVSPARTGRTRCHAGEDDLGCSRFRRLRVSAERGACWEAHHHDHPIPQQQAGY